MSQAAAPAMRVYVACPFPAPVLDLFVQRFGAAHNGTGRVLDNDALIAAAQGMDALVITVTNRIDGGLAAALPASVKALCTYSVGTDHLDLDALRAKGIAVFSTPDVLNESCADTAMLLMLGAARRVIEGIGLIRQGTWTGWSPLQLIGHDVWGKRLGILGMGRIGRAIARRARGFGMQVHYHNRSRLAPDAEVGAHYHESLESLAGHSDFLCIACPANASTRGIVNAGILARLPAHAIVCNVARGDVIRDEDLVQALRSGAIAAAGLDVYAGEPDIHPAYRELPNVFGLPHIGSSTIDTRIAMGEILCSGLEAWSRGSRPANQLC
ncbi:2-hydroxyacid dehydrogenase [Parapusillimonas granuli]|uniref:D-glycerate dehydrogenase n=1 Tax=Parapusillimonas granuli TaxID=380911 RepID=A0A853G6I2_9BURK|nr:D-glycerate dehydrogenase [Parapusillimonas granuli]MBB5214169.1 glyoxylate reductase [Parapusillimonas granuli]NYT50590.1 D-glycerate dehydrogenase [Parapusillimonas granuli]